MADRIVVMNQGRVQQISPPRELYEKPANRFVAGFIGSPPMNFISGTLVSNSGRTEFLEKTGGTNGLTLSIPEAIAKNLKAPREGELVLGLRPEHLHQFRGQTPPGHSVFEANLTRLELIVPETLLHLKTAGHSLLARIPKLEETPREGERVRILTDLTQANFFCPTTGSSLLP